MTTLANLTDEKITKIFWLEDCFIQTVDSKGDSNHGMIYTTNKAGQTYYFHSYKLAFNYFVKMNWILK